MKLPLDSVIAAQKFTQYLLKWRPEDDKSAFLASAGYTLLNAAVLEAICGAKYCRWRRPCWRLLNMAPSS